MKKKLDTRFPASRIKKIMQADEDVGKIAMAVPLLVSKALELFLKDLCDRTYDITLQRGAKTMSSFHLKQCVESFNVFDFLGEIVSKVPNLGGSDATVEDRSVVKRRKLADDEENDSDEEAKRNKMHEMGHSGSNGRGRGRGRGRGCGRGSRAIQFEKCEDDPGISPQHDKHNLNLGSCDTVVRNFDLNVDLTENGETSTTPEVKRDEYPGLFISEMDKMVIGPLQFPRLDRRLDEEDEDYDEEG